MLFVLLSKRFLHMTVLDGFAFVAIHANLLDCYKLQKVYEAIFGTSYTGRVYSKMVGELGFDATTKGDLLKIVGLTSRYNKIDS